MSRITTHVLDMVLGKPAVGVGVRLETQEGGGWIEVSTSGAKADREYDVPGTWVTVSVSATDVDGRCRDLAPNAAEGIYRLIFFTDSYLRGQGRSTIYPEISITFVCGNDAHYHLPLLLSDNGYTTYRGS